MRADSHEEGQLHLPKAGQCEKGPLAPAPTVEQGGVCGGLGPRPRRGASEKQKAEDSLVEPAGTGRGPAEPAIPRFPEIAQGLWLFQTRCQSGQGADRALLGGPEVWATFSSHLWDLSHPITLTVRPWTRQVRESSSWKGLRRESRVHTETPGDFTNAEAPTPESLL